MIALVLADHEIARAIVRSNAVDMVNYGLRRKATTKGTLCNQNVLVDPSAICFRVIRSVDLAVSSFVVMVATFPVICTRSAVIVTMNEAIGLSLERTELGIGRLG